MHLSLEVKRIGVHVQIYSSGDELQVNFNKKLIDKRG
jgi:hypothetical protein